MCCTVGGSVGVHVNEVCMEVIVGMGVLGWGGVCLGMWVSG